MIDKELEALLEPLERFETLRRGAVRFGTRLSDLSYANPYDGACEAVRTALRETLGEERLLDLQYSPFGGETLSRRAVADALSQSHGLPFIFRDVVLTPGAMSALQLALRAAGRPGQEVIVAVPSWLDHPLYVRFVGLEPRLLPLTPPRFDLDADAIEDAISERTCALVLSHPSNPTGRNYAPADLSKLGEALRRAERRLGCQVTVIADETHRDFVLPGEYHSLARFCDRTIVVYSFGKYHFMQGQRLGYAAASPRHPRREEVAEEMIRWARITGIATPTKLMQRAIPRLLGLRHDHSWLEEWRSRVLDQLTRVGYVAVQPDATMFVYLRTPPSYLDDFAFVADLAARGVLVLPAPVFHHQGYFRLSLTASRQMLERALPILDALARA